MTFGDLQRVRGGSELLPVSLLEAVLTCYSTLQTSSKVGALVSDVFLSPCLKLLSPVARRFLVL